MLTILFIVLAMLLCIVLVNNTEKYEKINGKGWGNVNGLVAGDYAGEHPSWLWEYPECYFDCIYNCRNVCEGRQNSSECLKCQRTECIPSC
jgi:hypothetical protein